MLSNTAKSANTAYTSSLFFSLYLSFFYRKLRERKAVLGVLGVIAVLT